MKKNYFASCVLSGLSLLLLVSCESVTSTQRTQLTTNGKSDYSIVIASEKNRIYSERFAAEELRNYLEKITGVTLPIVEEGINTGPGIYIGATGEAKKAGITVDKLGREEWSIKTRGKDLIIAGGRPRGTLYGVYEFLDKFGGCRWLSYDIEVVPKNRNFNLPSIDITGKPAFSYRRIGFYGGKIDKERQALYLTRNRSPHKSWRKVDVIRDAPRYGFIAEFGSPDKLHSLMAYQKSLKDVKPEYFAMTSKGERTRPPSGNVSGMSYPQICLTNQELRSKIFERLVGYIKKDGEEAAKKGKPAPLNYALSMNDNCQFCFCPSCQSINEREGSYCGVYMDFVNEIADRLKPLYPEIKITMDAYTLTKNPPKNLRPRDNVIVRLALLDREFRRDELADTLRPITNSTNVDAALLWKDWAKIVSPGNLAVYDYVQLYRKSFRYPYDVINKVAENLEFYNKMGCGQVEFESGSMDAPFYWLRNWIFFQKSLNPNRDTNALIDDFMKGYFGPAAKPMRQYYDFLVKSTLSGDKPLGLILPRHISYLNEDFFRKVNAWLDEAEKLCEGDGMNQYQRNIRFERIPVDSGMLYLWDKFKKKPGFSPADRDRVLERYQNNKKLLAKLFPYIGNGMYYNGGRLEEEFKALKIPAPEKFKDRDPNILYAINMNPDANHRPFADPDSICGYAVRLGPIKNHELKTPFVAKIHDSAIRKDSKPLFKLSKPVSDGGYHWYKIGVAPLTPTCVFWATYASFSIGWAALPPPNNELEVWASLKFIGPEYVPGSSGPNEVRLAAILTVSPEKTKSAERKKYHLKND